MMPIRRTLLASLALAPWLARSQDRPAEALLKYEGQTFERHIRLGGAELQLNGTGVRQVAGFKGFLAALWMVGRASDPAQVATLAGPKRLQLRIVLPIAIPAVEFAKAFTKGVSRNAAGPDEVARLEARMQVFDGLVKDLDKVRDGDVIDLDFEPARGTVLSFNGKPRGPAIAGDDFYAALLRAFVGDLPYDPKLKAGLLGRPV